jgi:hypothetical protein
VKVVAVSGNATYIPGVQMNPLTWNFFFYRYLNLPEKKILEPFEIIFLNTLALRSQILTDLNPLEKIPGAATV